MKTKTKRVGQFKLELSKNLTESHLFTLKSLTNNLRRKAFRLAYQKASGTITLKRFDSRLKEGRPVITPPYRLLIRQISALDIILSEHGLWK